MSGSQGGQKQTWAGLCSRWSEGWLLRSKLGMIHLTLKYCSLFRAPRKGGLCINGEEKCAHTWWFVTWQYCAPCSCSELVHKAVWKYSNLPCCRFSNSLTKLLLHNISLKQKQTSPRLCTLTLSLSLPSQSRSLSADADSWRRTRETAVPGNKHHLNCTQHYGCTLREEGQWNAWQWRGKTCKQEPSFFFSFFFLNLWAANVLSYLCQGCPLLPLYT